MRLKKKNRFDALHEIRNFWWERFEFRVKNTWRMSLSIWTVLALYIGSIAAGKIKIATETLFCIPCLIGLIIVLLHMWWLVKAGEANNHDRKKSNKMDKLIMKLVDYPWPDSIAQKEQEFRAKTGTLTHWSHIFFIIVTFVLVAFALLLTYSKTSI